MGLNRINKNMIDPEFVNEVSNNKNKIEQTDLKVDQNYQEVTSQLAQKAEKSKVDQMDLTLAEKANQTEVDELSGRVDNFSDLPDGSTTNDARLEDIAVGVDGTVFTSPGEAVREQLSRKANAVNLVNLISNGNFATDDLSGWTAYGGQLTVENGELVKTLDTLADSAYVGFGFQKYAGHQYYISFQIKPKYNETLRLYLTDVLKTIDVELSVNTFNNVSAIITPDQDSNSPSDFRIRHSTSTNYQVGDQIKYDNVLVIDLTESFGAGNEPNKEQMDSLLQEGWFQQKNLPLPYLISWSMSMAEFMTSENEEWEVI